MSKFIVLKGRTALVEYGLFPILVSSDRKEDGMLLSNKAKCLKPQSAERFYLQPGEKKVLKKVVKESKFKKITIARGDAQSSFKMLADVLETNVIK